MENYAAFYSQNSSPVLLTSKLWSETSKLRNETLNSNLETPNGNLKKIQISLENFI